MDIEIDLTKAWEQYYFPSIEDRYVFRKKVMRIAQEELKDYCFKYPFLARLAAKVIEVLAINDPEVIDDSAIKAALMTAFYHNDIIYWLEMAGVKMKN